MIILMRRFAPVILLVLVLVVTPGTVGIPVHAASAEIAPSKNVSATPEAHNPTTPLSDGQLDSTFGDGGKVTTAFPGGYDTVRGVALQSDGKIVMAGNATGRFTVGRYLPDGTLDPGFGEGGLVKTYFGGRTDQANAVAVQSDGKIVAAGLEVPINGGSQFALARYNSDGFLDLTFGMGGKVTTSFPAPSTNQAFAVAIQQDGKIVAAGTNGADSPGHFALARYNADGSLDSSFGSGGLVVTSINMDSQINAVAIQTDGKIVAAGRSAPTSGSDSGDVFTLARYDSNGSLDTSFGSGGIVTTSIGGVDDIANSVILQPNGRIVAGGSAATEPGGPATFALARYNENGSLDTSFGAGGIVTTSIGPGDTSDVATALLLRTDGRIYAAGYSLQYGTPGDYNFAIARYMPNGTLDSSFGSHSSGKVTTDLGSTGDYAYAAALQSNGRIVVAGTVNNLTDSISFGYGSDWATVRYLPTGELDSSFGTGGLATTDGGAGDDAANGVVVQSDGKIVAAGSDMGIGGGDFALARYNVNGTPDAAFGTGGKVTTDFEEGPDGAYAVLLQPDQKIVAAGLYLLPRGIYDTAGGFALARYNPDGTLDPTFGSGGKVTTDLSGGHTGSGVANAAVLQPDGKIVVAGTKYVGSCFHFCLYSIDLARYNPDGTLDQSFGSGGIVNFSFPNSYGETATAIGLQPDGKIVVAGRTYDDFRLARFNTDGSLDSGFGNDGVVATDFNNQADWVQALAVQPDGKIIAAGAAGVTVNCNPNYCVGGLEFGLARYGSSGALDTSFGTGGKTTTLVSGLDTVNALALQRDGKIVAAGQFGNASVATPAGFALARYTPAGALDPSFGVGASGVVTTAFGVQGAALAMALQPDSKIIAVGQGTTEDGGLDFALARYTNTPISRCPGERFFDVCPGDYFYTATLALADAGILSGYNTAPPCPEGISVPCFKPYYSSTRGQISKVVALAAGMNDPVTSQTFEDVPPGATFYTYTEQMAERGIVSGYPCGSPNEPCVPPLNRPYFRTGNNVTRGQLSKMISLAFNWSEPASGRQFQDVPQGSTFYTYVSRLYNRGIINGYQCGGANEPCVPPANLPYFRPNNNVTRGQTAKIVQLARTQSAPTPTTTPVNLATSTPTYTLPTSTATVTSVPTGTSTDTPAPTSSAGPTSSPTTLSRQ